MEANKKILIVDDESAHLESILDVFEEEGCPYRILQALDGQSALSIAQTEVPDLIITDWEMPGMNGIELIQKLKSDRTTKEIPVIMCTGVMTSSENLKMALQAGAVDYVRKPIDRIELIARTKANLHLSESYRRIKRLNQTKDKFFSIISHDVKTPLNSLLSFTTLIRDHVDSLSREEIRNLAIDLGDSVKNVGQLLENLLEWSNTQSDVLDFTPELVNIHDVVDANRELFKEAAKKKSVTIDNEVSDEITARVHKNSFGTIIRNLLSNAIKFTPESGKITITAQRDNDVIVVAVADTGVGLSPEDAELIFQSDKRHTTKGTANEKGTGLGLILCKELVEKMGGTITVQSEAGKGSRFEVRV